MDDPPEVNLLGFSMVKSASFLQGREGIHFVDLIQSSQPSKRKCFVLRTGEVGI